ncbi:MAG: tryptophan--tRNA ligase [Alphaproteobacteria bacterium]|nr:tryptophan--tRNA ligase [Alphaproteobacteria bacterium]
MNIVVSGIRPTGNLHLGNYFGALKSFVKMQEENQCFFFIADYHSLTTHPTPADLHGNVRTVLAEFLACGLDPDKATIYIQSDLPETAELYLLLNMNAYIGELERCTSFKEKIRTQPQNVNAGLLTYPTLMAADIIIHKAHRVPVGKDQEQHLEMTRTFANRFNRLYKVDYFPEPTAFTFEENLVKIPGLDGSLKMSKSDNENSAIFLADTPEQIRKKVMRAVTDSGQPDPEKPRSQGVENLFTLMGYFSSPATLAFFEEQYAAATIRYGDMKKQLAEDIILFVNPIRERIQTVASDDAYLKKAARTGADKARASASTTIREVREIIGFRHF